MYLRREGQGAVLFGRSCAAGSGIPGGACLPLEVVPQAPPLQLRHPVALGCVAGRPHDHPVSRLRCRAASAPRARFRVCGVIHPCSGLPQSLGLSPQTPSAFSTPFPRRVVGQLRPLSPGAPGSVHRQVAPGGQAAAFLPKLRSSVQQPGASGSPRPTSETVFLLNKFMSLIQTLLARPSLGSHSAISGQRPQ